MYNDEMKCLDKKYHQCLKEVIIAKINELATELVGNGIGLYGIANIPSDARNAYNVYNIYKGTRNLENQLQLF